MTSLAAQSNHARSQLLDRLESISLPHWATFLLVALIARAITFGNPIVHVDEQFYFVVARSWLDGALPYVDVWDRKPIGLFMLYLPAAALGYPAGIWAYQATALAAVVATALLIGRLTERAGWGQAALAAGAAYILGLNFLEGEGGQSPVFYNLLIAGAALLIAPRGDDFAQPALRFRRGLAAMALIGLALQIKYAAVFEGVYFGLWWVWREHRCGRALPAIAWRGAALAAIAAVPTLVAWRAYAVIGRANDFEFANFFSIGLRRMDGWPELALNLGLIATFTSPLAVGALLALRIPEDQRQRRRVRSWLVGWALAALLGMLALGEWFDHYALPLLVPLSVCAAGFTAKHRLRRFTIHALLAALVLGQGVLIAKEIVRGRPSEFAGLLQAVGKGPGCLYVYAGPTMLYSATGRCRVTRFIFPSHLGHRREKGAVGVDQVAEIGRIFASQPDVVVVGSPFHDERPEQRALVLAYLRQDYQPTTRVPLGSGTMTVFRRRDDLPAGAVHRGQEADERPLGLRELLIG